MLVAFLFVGVIYLVVLGCFAARALYTRRWKRLQNEALVEVLLSCNGRSSFEVRQLIDDVGTRLQGRKWPFHELLVRD